MLSLLLTIFTFVEFNCENLFDLRHDSLKNDMEYCEGGAYHWNSQRYWHKLNNIGKEIVPHVLFKGSLSECARIFELVWFYTVLVVTNF